MHKVLTYVMPKSFWSMNNTINHKRTLSEYGIKYEEKDGEITIRSFDEVLGHEKLSIIDPENYPEKPSSIDPQLPPT